MFDNKRIIIPASTGLAGIFLLMALYIGIMSLLQGWQTAWAVFWSEPWITLPMFVGFGLQVALYTILKKQVFFPAPVGGPSGMIPGVSGGSSVMTMMACCAHQVTNMLPILGLTAASTLLMRYQTQLMLGSLAINLVGIGILVVMLFRTQRNFSGGFKKIHVAAIFTVLLLTFLTIRWQVFAAPEHPVAITAVTAASAVETTPTWPEEVTRTDRQGPVKIEITPLNPNSSGLTLDFLVVLQLTNPDQAIDLAQMAILETDTGLRVDGIQWDAPADGSPRQGILSFPTVINSHNVLEDANQMMITISGLNAPLRIFTWER